MIFSLSYFIYDLIACSYYKLLDLSVVSHHLFCILGLGTFVWAGYGAIDGTGGLFCAEASNFFMHMRVILKILNKKNTKSYEYSENLYLGKLIFISRHLHLIQSNNLSIFCLVPMY